MGYTQDELRKVTTQTVTHPADLATDLEQIAKLARGELDQYSAEKRYIRKDGSSIWINNTVAAVRDSDPELSYLVSAVEDISARKASERSADLLAAIVNSSEDAIISKNLNGIITSWNAGAERLLGYSAEEAVGQSIMLIIPPERRDEEAEILARLKRGNTWSISKPSAWPKTDADRHFAHHLAAKGLYRACGRGLEGCQRHHRPKAFRKGAARE